eukprot:338601-Alexandrium_andersonii.AAC.1
MEQAVKPSRAAAGLGEHLHEVQALQRRERLLRLVHGAGGLVVEGRVALAERAQARGHRALAL